MSYLDVLEQIDVSKKATRNYILEVIEYHLSPVVGCFPDIDEAIERFENYIKGKTLNDNFEICSIERVSPEKVVVSFCEGGKYTRFDKGDWCDGSGYLNNKILERELEKSYRKFCGV